MAAQTDLWEDGKPDYNTHPGISTVETSMIAVVTRSGRRTGQDPSREPEEPLEAATLEREPFGKEKRGDPEEGEVNDGNPEARSSRP